MTAAKDATANGGEPRKAMRKFALNVWLYESLKLFEVHHARRASDFFTAFKNKEARNPHHAHRGWRVGIVLGVVLYNLELVAHFFCKLVHRGPHCFTWTTPWCPEVNQDGSGGFDHFLLEAFICDVKCVRHGSIRAVRRQEVPRVRDRILHAGGRKSRRCLQGVKRQRLRAGSPEHRRMGHPV